MKTQEKPPETWGNHVQLFDQCNVDVFLKNGVKLSGKVLEVSAVHMVMTRNNGGYQSVQTAEIATIAEL